jgi:plastocyanin
MYLALEMKPKLNHKIIYFLIAALAIVAVLYPVAYVELSDSNSVNNPQGCIPLLPCGRLTPASGICTNPCYVFMADASFVPETVNVTIGTEIIWINNDSITHTSTANNGQWNSNPIPPGQRFELLMGSSFVVGKSYYYHCEIHNQMLGLVNVVENNTQSS